MWGSDKPCNTHVIQVPEVDEDYLLKQWKAHHSFESTPAKTSRQLVKFYIKTYIPVVYMTFINYSLYQEDFPYRRG